MGNFVDFEEVKQKVSFAQAIAILKLNVKQSGNQMRSACPACKRGGDRALAITEGRGAYCQAVKEGGDVIWLAAHVTGTSVKDAANLLMARTVPSTVPKKEEEADSFQPLSYLEHDHAALLAIGFDPDIAKKLGIGFAPKGILRGTVAVPIRDENGTLIAYIGIEDAKLPPSMMGNVVPLRKPA